MFGYVTRALRRIVPTSVVQNVYDYYYAYSPFSQNRRRRTPHGFQLTGGNSVHHRGMQNGTFEPVEVKLIAETYRDDFDVFVDVGANIGFFSCLARQANKHVIAIEPQAANLRYLYMNMMANGWQDVEVFPVGLSKTHGVQYLYGVSSTSASLIPGWASTLKFSKRAIPLSTLDILIHRRFEGKRLFIKIDTEGVEYDVILGAEMILNMTPRPIFLVEITSGAFFPQGQNPHAADIFERFSRCGYTVTQVGMDGYNYLFS
jgi:FkbM family methyltransferase